MNFVLCTIVLFFTVQNVYCDSSGSRLCARSTITGPHNIMIEEPSNEEDGLEGDLVERSKHGVDPDTGIQYVQCSKQTHHCYAAWKEDANGTIIIFAQGCWKSSEIHDCAQTQCLNDKPVKANNTKFCCCTGDYCNINVTDIYVPMDDGSVSPKTGHLDQQTISDPRQTVIVTSVSICSLFFAIFVAFLVYHVWQNRKRSLGGAKGQSHVDQVHLMTPGYSAGLYSVDHLKLCSIVGQGRYGSVWKGVVNEQEVAVKIFPAHYRTYFYNERDIYCLPFMENPALLTYYGCDERINMDGHTEYLLVLSYAPNGCLQDYLNANVLDFQTFCKMASSIAKGLSHLHTDVVKGDKIKPCVSHRDLNSRNILVKTDLSCCICDLGFAMKIAGSRYYQNGEEQHAETRSINEVGTRRYMAPEVLEGAVNLRDCETSLKQIDVYALGLVLWELATRCNEFYTTGEAQSYQLPFQQEIGLHPTLEQMQALVSRRKARPLFPVQWRDNAAARLVRDTAEDCWDQDAEARLTALCVEERLNELPLLRDRHNRATIYSTSPTYNSTQSNGTIINNNNHLNLGNGCTNGGTIEHMTSNQTANIIGNSLTGKDGMYDVSDGTVETLLSPTDPGEHTFKNSNQTAPYISNKLLLNYKQQQQQPVHNQPLQPYQGRNPCLERNLMLPTESEDNLQQMTNYVEKSFKHSTHYRSNSNTTESQGLISHDYLSQTGNSYNSSSTQVALSSNNRPATPIPYVQNVVYDGHTNGNLPKQQNTNATNEQQQQHQQHGIKSKFRWSGLRNLIDRKIFGRERLEPLPNEEEPKSNLIADNALQRKDPSVAPVPMNTQVNLISSKHLNGVITSVLHENSTCSTSSRCSTASTVSRSSGSGTKRPSTLPLIPVKTTSVTVTAAPEESKKLLRTEVVNPLKNQRLSLVSSNSITDEIALIAAEAAASAAETATDDKTIKVSDSTSGISQIIRRKNSLSKQQSLEQFNEVFSSTSDLSRLKDPNQRIKTPGDVPPSVRRTRGKASSSNVTRFSLYDDRMMSFDNNHWSSVPDDIDITIETATNKTVLKPPEVELLKCNSDSVSSF